METEGFDATIATRFGLSGFNTSTAALIACSFVYYAGSIEYLMPFVR
jgi:hypothetical protein